jgi:MSHA biogenesis protein MshJ
MKKLWTAITSRLDGMSRRERISVFAAAALAVLATVYVGAVEPQLARRKLLHARTADHERLFAAAEVQKRELASALRQDPDEALRARIAEQRQRIAAMDAQLAGLQRTLVSPERMASVLQQLAGKDQRVRLVSLRNLPAAPLVGSQPAGAPEEPRRGGPVPYVYKHGVEIVVQGSYLDVLRYVTRLEEQPWQVYWNKSVLSAEYPQVSIALTLYTLSLDRAWLVV